MPIKRGQTAEEVQHYYEQLMLRERPDEFYKSRSNLVSTFRTINKNNESVQDCLDFWEQALKAASVVVAPLIDVYNYVHRYVNNHIPWTSIELTGKQHKLIRPYEIFRCLRSVCRENQELILQSVRFNNRQRALLLEALEYNEGIDDFEAVYGEADNDQELSNICWDLGLYHPDDDMLYLSRFLDNYSYYRHYKEHTDNQDYDSAEYVESVSNISIIAEAERYYEQYCKVRRSIRDNLNHFNNKEKGIIDSIINRPEGEFFKQHYNNGKAHLLDVDLRTIREYRLLAKIADQVPPFEYVVKGRNPSKTWLNNRYAILSDEDAKEVLISSGIIADLEKMIRNRLTFPPNMDKGGNKNAIVNGLTGGLIFYVATKCEIAYKSETIPASFERTLTIEKPIRRSSILPYFVMLKDWFPLFNPDKQRTESQIKLYFSWEKQDSVRFKLLTAGNNYEHLQKNIEFLTKALPEAFDLALNRKISLIKLEKSEQSALPDYLSNRLD